MEEELSPEQAERVRRLLADARHTDPMPTEVADRLDRVLAEVAAEPGEPAVEQTLPGVVPLAQRRRRAGRLLLAAAAVVVGGVAVAQFASSGGGLDAGSESGLTADRGRQAPERETAEDEAPAAASDPGPGAVADHRMSFAKGMARTIRPDHFVRDARRARASSLAIYRAQYGSVDRPETAYGELAARDVAGCEPEAAWGGGRYVPVSYGGSGGWLVVRPPAGDTQVVDLFLCGEDGAVRSTTLPFR